jgi:hypothetical protein
MARALGILVPALRALQGAGITLGILLLMAGCGGSTCKRACKKMEECLGINQDGDGEARWTCPFADTCNPVLACKARCVMDADCQAVIGDLPLLKSCIKKCDEEPARLDQGGLPPDRGAPPPDTRKICTPSCAGKKCGGDGCGGSCGSCSQGLVCKAGKCEPDTPPECYPINECQYVGQKLCTGANRYRACKKTYSGCLAWDCST